MTTEPTFIPVRVAHQLFDLFRVPALHAALDVILTEDTEAAAFLAMERYSNGLAPAVLGLRARYWADSARTPPPPVSPAALGLTDREAEVLPLIVEGLTSNEIGQRLFLSEHTVKSHIKTLLEKSGQHSRAALVAWAFRRGLAR